MNIDLDTSVLAPQAVQVLRDLFGDLALGAGFYLAGGTGLALQIGHRTSNDLDLFTVAPTERLPASAPRVLAALPSRVTVRERGQIDLETVTGGTRVSLVAYPFPLMHALVTGDLRAKGPLQLAPSAEIALMKAYALGRRITARDYVDLYYLLRGGHAQLEQIRREGETKFRLGGEKAFSYLGFLRLLVDSSDAEDWPETLSLVRQPGVTRAAVEDYLVDLVRQEGGVV